MHGRLKVRTSAEEAARKKKEQALKVKAYRAGISAIFEKRTKDELDNEMMLLISQILARNPDIYTLWNIRRECILRIRETLNDEEQQSIFNKDLDFTEQCLMVNPKSYCAWHHRCWVLVTCPSPNWKNEVYICTKYLKIDERNFHCWDYRRFVVDRAGIPLADELEFCTEKIKKNFSNYSSWHYRSKILPILYPHEEIISRPICETKLKEELEIVLTAAFTDPNDSSAWFYQRWLLGYSQPAFDIASFRITRNLVVISFTKPIDISDLDITLNSNLKIDFRKFKNLNTENQTDYTWSLSGDFTQLSSDEILILTCKEKNGLLYNLDLIKINDGYGGINLPKFEYEFGDTIIDVLRGQLESCNQLLEYEPENKWTLLTSSLLMRAIDRRGYHQKTLEHLNKLKIVDNLRRGYYNDLASKWNTENILQEWIIKGIDTKVDLSGLNLTDIFYEQYFSIANDIDLSNNNLSNRSQSKLNTFKFCKNVNLLGNEL